MEAKRPWHQEFASENPAKTDPDCADLVIAVYTSAMKNGPGQRRAFEAAVHIWRERNPSASPEMAGPAVATILCQKL